MREYVYSKPEMKKVSLENENKVADTCWGNAGKGITYYCDLEGPGWASFQIADGSCSLNLINVKYHTDTNDNGVADNFDGYTELRPSDARYKELTEILRTSGGESGNPYKGMEVTVFPEDPQPQWS